MNAASVHSSDVKELPSPDSGYAGSCGFAVSNHRPSDQNSIDSFPSIDPVA